MILSAIRIFTGVGFESILRITLQDGTVVESCSAWKLKVLVQDAQGEDKLELLAELELAEQAEAFIRLETVSQEQTTLSKRVEKAVKLLEDRKDVELNGHSFRWSESFEGFEGTNPYGQPCFGGSDARELVESLAAGETFGSVPE